MRHVPSFVLASVAFLSAPNLRAQDMLQGVDLAQPAYSTAELTRADVEAALRQRTKERKVDLSEKSLNGLDLSGLDLHGVNFRAARMNKARLAGARLDDAILDQAWLIEADLSGASLKGAHAFASQMQRMRADGADFAHARLAGDLTGASARGANFADADLSADMKNQSMGLMRAVLRSTALEGARFHNANLASADLRFAKAARADFSNANLTGADAAGADFTDANWTGAKTEGLDLDSAQIDSDARATLSDAQNIDRARMK
ncbi:MAG: pentapeptide repeat-containing protein [Methylocystis sp.]